MYIICLIDRLRIPCSADPAVVISLFFSEDGNHETLRLPSIHVASSRDSESKGSIITADIEDPYTLETYSFLTYAHINGHTDVLDSKTITHEVDGITYQFNLDDFDHPKVTFQQDGVSYSISDDGENVTLTETDSWFHKKIDVCKLPAPDCFYSPISVAGIEGYCIVLVNSIETTSEIMLYRQQDKEWVPCQFENADSTRSDVFYGYVRRYFDLSKAGMYVGDDKRIGNMELCTVVDSTATLYSAAWSNDKITLSVKTVFSNGLPVDWKF